MSRHVAAVHHRSGGTPCYRAAMELRTEWLGRMGYRAVWERQHALVTARATGEAPDTLLLLEHDAVLTLGRHADPANVLAAPDALAARGIETIRVERGGEVTYHGPGQLVAYPIVRLADAGLLLRPFVRALELAMADTAASYGVQAERRQGYPGCWVDPEGSRDRPRKLGALGLRVERGVTYHGIALNVTTRLADFELIEPCGLSGIEVTSMARELGWTGASAEPSTASVEDAAERFASALGRRLDEAVDASVAPRRGASAIPSAA
jgi:lipoyl(octanoyl) transferase